MLHMITKVKTQCGNFSELHQKADASLDVISD